MKTLDENDKAARGTLPTDPEKNTRPIQLAPKIAPPRILTVKELLEAAAERSMDKRPSRACTTGVKGLDYATGGFCPGQVWVIGADTNWGKSSFAIMVADENLQDGKRVLIVSSEDDESIYGDRLMVRRARVNAMRFRDRNMTPEEYNSVADVLARAEPAPVFLDARGKKAERVAEEVRWAIATHDVDLVIYDYLQEFRSSKRHEDRRNEVSEVAAILREAIKTSGKTGIIFSQITIQVGKKYPDKHSIRESRDVSNAADVIALGFTPTEALPGKNGQTSVDAGTKCVLIDKVKQGIKGTVPLDWNEEGAFFETDTRQPKHSATTEPSEDFWDN